MAVTTSDRGARATVLQRVAVIVPYGNLDTIPVLCDLGEVLAEQGYAVDIYTTSTSLEPAPSFASPRVNVLRLPGPLGRPSRRLRTKTGAQPASAAAKPRTVAWRVQLRRMAARLNSMLFALDPFDRFRWWRRRDEDYQLVIGVDPEGLVSAASLSRATGASLVYYSLELLPSADISGMEERALKWREIRLSREASAIVIQDPDRAQVLLDDNGVEHDRIIFTPNAPRGRARREPTRWWHERFDIRADQRVLLYSGSLASWAGVDELVASAEALPEEWVIAVHSNHRPGSAAHWERLKTEAPAGKVFFSDSAVARQDYRPVIDGADAGVAMYVPEPGRWSMTNLEVLGLASGKVSYYLWCGLPVVVGARTTLRTLVESEGIGVTIGDDGLVGAVGRLSADYDAMSARAIGFFDQNLDFDVSGERLANAFGRMVGTESATGRDR